MPAKKRARNRIEDDDSSGSEQTTKKATTKTSTSTTAIKSPLKTTTSPSGKSETKTSTAKEASKTNEASKLSLDDSFGDFDDLLSSNWMKPAPVVAKKGASLSSRRKGAGTAKASPTTKYTWSLDRLLEDKDQKPVAEEEEEFEFEPPTELNKSSQSDDLNLSQESFDESFSKEKIDDLLSLQDELQKDVRDENVFRSWPKALPEPSLIITDEDFEGASTEQTLVLTDLQKETTSQRELVMGGWLLSCFPYNTTCPVSVMKWLFSLVAYSNDHDMAISAFSILENRITRHPKSQLNILRSSFFLSDKYSAASYGEENSEWVPSYNDFVGVFANYGMDISEYSADYMSITEGSSTTAQKEFPNFNLSLLVDLLGLYVLERPQQFSSIEVEYFCHLLSKIALDPKTNESLMQISACISKLLGWFPVDSWYNSCLGRLCDLLSSSTLTQHHQNYSRVVLHIPLTSQRGRELRARLSFKYLNGLFGSTPSEEKIRQGPTISDLTELVQRIPSGNDADFSQIRAMVTLLDQCINDKNIVRSDQKGLEKLLSKLRVLNSLIREVSGYNRLISMVKELIVLMTTKLTQIGQQAKSIYSQQKIKA